MIDFLINNLVQPSSFAIPERMQVLERIARSKRLPLLERIRHLASLAPQETLFDPSGAAPRFESPAPTAEFLRELEACVLALVPWRKGPFHLFGMELDAEWRSDFKWERLGLSELQGKRIADVGCGNGYYLLKLLGLRPREIVGFDPTDRYLLQYLLLRTLIPGDIPIGFEPLRSDALSHYESFFDLTLCLGVLYHHPQPEQLLRELFISLQPGGTLLLETIYSPEDSSLNLNGESPYARMRNVYLIPTLTETERLLRNAGFRNIECTSRIILSLEEQRRTPFAPGDSLEQFLDSNDRSRTREGYFRPHRAIFRAER